MRIRGLILGLALVLTGLTGCGVTGSDEPLDDPNSPVLWDAPRDLSTLFIAPPAEATPEPVSTYDVNGAANTLLLEGRGNLDALIGFGYRRGAEVQWETDRYAARVGLHEFASVGNAARFVTHFGIGSASAGKPERLPAPLEHGIYVPDINQVGADSYDGFAFIAARSIVVMVSVTAATPDDARAITLDLLSQQQTRILQA